jgi:hypothetical protein
VALSHGRDDFFGAISRAADVVAASAKKHGLPATTPFLLTEFNCGLGLDCADSFYSGSFIACVRQPSAAKTYGRLNDVYCVACCCVCGEMSQELCNVIEAPWLVNVGHSASLRQPRAQVSRYELAEYRRARPRTVLLGAVLVGLLCYGVKRPTTTSSALPCSVILHIHNI